MASLVEDFVLTHLSGASLDYLIGLTEEFQLAVADEKRGDKPSILKIVLRHLTKEDIEKSPDKGAAIFLKIYQELGEELNKVGFSLKREELGEGSSSSVKDEDDEATTTLSYRKLRQFKIHGKIGDPGESGCLSFSSLNYQIQNGVDLKYEPKEIYTGVIRAITAGNPLRDVLELEESDFSKENLIKTLKSHFEEKDPNSLLNVLRTLGQEENETAHKFCCRAIALRKRIARSYRSGDPDSDSESQSLEFTNLTDVFFNTINIGLRNDNIRNELLPTIKQQTASNHDLLEEVSAAAARESQRLLRQREVDKSRKAKIDNSSKVAIKNVTFVDSDSDDGTTSTSSSSSKSSQSSSKQKKIPVAKSSQKSQPDSKAWAKLVASIDSLAATNAQLVADVNVLKSGYSAKGHTPNPQNGGNVLNASAPVFRQTNHRVPFRCHNCNASNSPFCNHCLKCGNPGHRIRDCPEN